MTVSMIIGGGQSSRMGQDKAQLEKSGRTLLEHAIDALDFCSEIVVVAPERKLHARDAWPPVRFCLEDPPLGGPVAGVAAGVAALESSGEVGGSGSSGVHSPDIDVIVLPVDMPNPHEAVAQLRAASLGGDGGVGGGADGVALEDEEGWIQYLLGRYRLSSMRRALEELGDPRDKSMRKFGTLLQVTPVPVSNDTLIDVDTPQDAKTQGIKLKPKARKKDDPEVLARLEKWQKALRAELGIDDELFDQEKVLDLAAIIASDVARPGVPVTGYLVGLAVGAAVERGEPVDEAIARVFEIAENPKRLIEPPNTK